MSGRRPQLGGSHRSIRVLGVQVHDVGIAEVVSQIQTWIADPPGASRVVLNTGMHGLNIARQDATFRATLNHADLFFPDGIALVLIGRLHGLRVRKRDTGPALLTAFCDAAEEHGWRSYFYGDTEATLHRLRRTLMGRFPRLAIAGMESPPFRDLTAREIDSTVERINQAAPDVLWVGLGCPKQERWIVAHRQRLRAKVILGVGAYFKFHAGIVRRAPAPITNAGFEWLWRLVHEPRRCWRRYVIDAPQFLLYGLAELATRPRE